MAKSYIDELEKNYGHKVIIRFDGITPYPKLEAVSTSSFRLDRALGNGGVPLGRITEFYGPFSGGKSSVLQHVMANAQAKYPDKRVAIIDSEIDSFEPGRAQNTFGIDLTRVDIHRPESGEQAWTVVEAMLRSKEFSVIGVDSIANLVPAAEAAVDFEKNSIGLQARLTSRAMRQLGPLVATSGTALILINQIRVNIQTWGTSEGRTGGHALDHACSLIVRFARTDFIKEGSEVIGIEVKAAVTKNKVGPPKREAEFKLYFDKGIDTQDELISVGLESGVIVKAGSWFRHKDDNIGQGINAAAAWLMGRPDVQAEIAQSIA